MPRKSTDLLSAHLFYFISCYALILINVIVSYLRIDISVFSAEFALQMIVIETVAIAVPPLFFIFFPYWKTFRKNMRINKINLTILLIIPIGIVGYLFINYLTVVWMCLLMMLGLSPEAGAAASAIPTPETTGMFLWSLLAIAVTPALCEEFLFRGLIMPAYERHFRKPIVAILLSGTIFGLMHGQFLSMPGHVILGILLGYIVIVTESLWAGVLLHFIQNGMAMCMLYLQKYITSFIDSMQYTNAPSAALFQIAAGRVTAAGAVDVLGGDTLSLLVISVVCMLFFGAVYFGLLALLYYLYKRRNGKSPFARADAPPILEETAIGYIPDPMLPQTPVIQQDSVYPQYLPDPAGSVPLTAWVRPVPKKTGFLPWLPLVLTAPLILFEYLLTFLTMVPGFMDWMQSLMRNAWN